jgi:hypothetical protein
MTAQSDPYVRVYYRIRDDERFIGVYRDDAALALWLRLLLLADAMYPTSAPIPRGVRKAALDTLVRAGLVELVPDDCYRIHGLAAERERQSQRGRAGASARWSERDAIASLTHSDRTTGVGSDALHSAPLRSSPLRSAPDAGDADPSDAYDVMLLVERLTHRPFAFREGSPVHDTLVGDVATHGAVRIAAEYRAMHEASAAPLDAAQLVFGVHNALHPLIRPRALSDDERREAEVEAAIRLVRGGAS